MKVRSGVTLISLIVTIIVLLLLAAVSIALTLGPEGILNKSRESKVEARYSTVMDKMQLRDAELKMSIERGEVNNAESASDFIKRMGEFEGILNLGNAKHQDKTEGNNIFIGRVNDNDFKYTITVSDVDDVVNMANSTEMILKIKTTKSNEEVELPISNTAGLTINWGESENSVYQTPNSPSDPYFEYPTAKDGYTVKIKGTAANNARFGSNDADYWNENIVGIKSWGENGFYAINSFGESLKGKLPSPSKKSFKNVKTFRHAFSYCTGLEGSIPEDLFSSCSNVESFDYTFRGCEGLEGSIPKDLFKSSKNVKSFNYTFIECSGLTGSIPVNLFKSNPKVTNFNGTFQGCSGLNGSIPGGLFSGNANANTFYNTFRGCTGFTGSIPGSLFSKQIGATNFSNTFYNCTGLSGNIPANLFSANPNVTTFAYLFYNCSGLTGNAPELWNTHNATSFSHCFTGCTGLSNRNDILKTWGGLKN